MIKALNNLVGKIIHWIWVGIMVLSSVQTSIERGPLSTASISFLQILLKRENGRRIDKLVGNFQEV